LASAKISFGTMKPPKFIKCDCGSKISVLPDSKLLGKIIEVHAAEHAQTKSDFANADEEAARIENLLIEKVFKKAFAPSP
jgi:hypothetical protein